MTVIVTMIRRALGRPKQVSISLCLLGLGFAVGWPGVILAQTDLTGLSLTSTSGNDYTTDTLNCSYTLTGGATTAATAWYTNSAPIMSSTAPRIP